MPTRTNKLLIMEYIALSSGLIALIGSFYAGAQKLVTITELLVQIREQGRINNVAIEALRIYDTDLNSRVNSIENYLEKTTDFTRR